MADKTETPPAPTDSAAAQRLHDLGAELASLRSDFEKAKADGVPVAALRGEMDSLKAEIKALTKTNPEAAESFDDDYAGFWSGLFAPLA